MYRAASDLQSDPPRFATAAAATTTVAAAAIAALLKEQPCPELSLLRVDLTYDAPVERHFNDTLSE